MTKTMRLALLGELGACQWGAGLAVAAIIGKAAFAWREENPAIGGWCELLAFAGALLGFLIGGWCELLAFAGALLGFLIGGLTFKWGSRLLARKPN